MTIHPQEAQSPVEVGCCLNKKKVYMHFSDVLEICLLASKAAKQDGMLWHSMGENNASAVRNKTFLQVALYKNSEHSGRIYCTDLLQLLQDFLQENVVYYYYYFLCHFFSHFSAEELLILLYPAYGRIDSLQQNYRHQRKKVQYNQWSLLMQRSDSMISSVLFCCILSSLILSYYPKWTPNISLF